MSRSVLDRLRDIVDSADLATNHGGQLNAEALAVSDQQRDATLYRIALIGEAVSKLPTDVQALAPEISWNDIRSMRNHIIHGYWQIDFKLVVETIAKDLDPLKAAARRLMPLVERDET